MANNLEVKIVGEKELIGEFQRLSSKEMTDLLANIGEALVQSTQRRFDQEKSPEGENWKELAPSTIAKPIIFNRRFKPKQRKPYKKLYQTGRLKKSINYQLSGNQVLVGTDIEYAPTHQFGLKMTIGPRKKKALKFLIADGTLIMRKKARFNIPARPFLGFSKEDEKKIENIVDDFLKK